MSITDQDSGLRTAPKDHPRVETRADSESTEAITNQPIEFVSQPRMAKELDCTIRSLNRKKPTDPDFPLMFDINGRKYSRRPDFEHYKRILVRRGLEKAPQALPQPNKPPRTSGSAENRKGDIATVVDTKKAE
jgi:hypothetical protein